MTYQEPVIAAEDKVAYQKPVIVAENKAEGKFNAGCPPPEASLCFACDRSRYN